jgi:hypothetical protein
LNPINWWDNDKGWVELTFSKFQVDAQAFYRYRVGHRPYIVINENLQDSGLIFDVFIKLIGAHVAFITGQLPPPTDKFYLILRGDLLFKKNR